MVWVFILSNTSCSNSTLEPDFSTFGYDFYPLETGAYRTYQVLEVIHSPLNLPDTSVFELKEVVADTFTDNAEQLNYVLQRFKRLSSEDPWILDSLWATYRNEIQAIVYENNIPVMKLVFPLMERKKWDANSLSSKASDEYEMIDLFVPYQENGLDFNSTVTVLQEENLDSLIFFDFRKEIYAKNLGLVEKTVSRLKFCQDDSCIGQKIIEEGRQYKQVLIEYGME